jgi:adducin
MPSLKTDVNPHPKTSDNTMRLMGYAPVLNAHDPDFMREIMRPAEIKEDLSLMENRKRVSLILNSESFRRDLEEVVKLQLQSGPYPDSWAALQSLSDLLVPRAQYGAAASTFTKGSFMPAMPINDLRSAAASKNGENGVPHHPNYSKAERMLRCKLASVFRLVDIFGWSAVMSSCITARLSSVSDAFLMNPFGLLYHEITASSLVKINLKGEVLDAGSTGLHVDTAAWLVPSAIHAARKDIRCVIQLRNPATVAVSAMKCGLLPLSQEAMICGPVAIYDPFHSEQDNDEFVTIAKALGERAKILLVRSHGLYACGNSVEEAWHYAFNAIAACQAQLKLLPLGLEKLVLPGEALRESVYQVGSRGSAGVEMHGKETTESDEHTDHSVAEREVGELEFAALMRQLDQAGYRTGYLYRPTGEPIERGLAESGDELSAASDDDVLVPPAASSYLKSSDEKSATLPPGVGASYWSNTPNAYMREEIDEIGTPNPKKIVCWREAAGEKPTSGLAQAILSPNQFAPQGTDPLEYKGRQQEIKEHYFNDKVDAGHQSKLLENITDEEARKMQEAREGKLTGEHVVIVGAVSKGIIQRDHRHNVAVYQSVYATNPFHQITDADLQEYQKEIRRKNATPEELAKLEAEEQEERLAAERLAAAASSSEVEDTLTSSTVPQVRTLPPLSTERDSSRLSAEGSGGPDLSPTTPTVVSATLDVPDAPIMPTIVSSTRSAPPTRVDASVKRNESDRKGNADRGGPSSGHYATLATPGRTDTSEAEFTTHTEVTDTEVY